MKVKILKQYKKFSYKKGEKRVKVPGLNIGDIKNAREYGVGLTGSVAIDSELHNPNPQFFHIVKKGDYVVI